MICLKVSSTSETYREETETKQETMICLKVSPTSETYREETV